ncbi:MAG: anti-sigma factor [Nevskia sp.]|nr:anti-sigma factor [Nevskia sp.]
MKYQDQNLRRTLAGEYVLGTLRGAARRRFEKLAGQDPALRDEVQAWEQRLGGLAELEPVAPPPTAWLSLQLRIKTGNSVPLRRLPSESRAAGSPPIWRIWAGLAAAVAMVSLVMLAQYRPQNQADQVARLQQPEPSAARDFVALLKMPGSSLQWTVSLSPSRGMITAEAAGDYIKLGLRSMDLQLWWVSPQGPVPLGVLPLVGEGVMPLPKGMPMQGQITLAVSLEPPAGSPTGKPTGPVLTSAPAANGLQS